MHLSENICTLHNVQRPYLSRFFELPLFGYLYIFARCALCILPVDKIVDMELKTLALALSAPAPTWPAVVHATNAPTGSHS